MIHTDREKDFSWFFSCRNEIIARKVDGYIKLLYAHTHTHTPIHSIYWNNSISCLWVFWNQFYRYMHMKMNACFLFFCCPIPVWQRKSVSVRKRYFFFCWNYYIGNRVGNYLWLAWHAQIYRPFSILLSMQSIQSNWKQCAVSSGFFFLSKIHCLHNESKLFRRSDKSLNSP